MASEQDDAVFPEEDLDDDDDESQDQEDEEEEDEDDEENEPSPFPSPSPSTSVAAAVVPGTATIAVTNSSPEPKRQRIEEMQIEEKKPLDDSRRLFQRLWTDEDEIGLLQGFLDYTAQRGSSHHHNDTALFYDQIKSKLQLDFNKNQLVEKLRRLKKKYRNVLSKISSGSGKEFSFKTPHDQASFEISRKIWTNMGPIGAAVEDNALDDDEINPNPNFSHSMSLKNEVMMGNSAEKRTPPSRKRSRSRSGIRTEMNDGSALNKDDNCISNNNCNSNHSIQQGLIEETVRNCLSPLLKELLLSSASAMGGPFGFGARGFGGFALNPMPLTLSLNFGSGEVVDDKWRKQQILELQVYSKRLELVQDQIKAALEELRSAGG